MLKILPILITILVVITPLGAENRYLAKRSAALQDTYFLKTKPKKGKNFICSIQKSKPLIGTIVTQTNTVVSYTAFKPKNTAEKKLLIKAEKECRTLSKRGACNDRRDNDLDGALDFPSDSGCMSEFDLSETAEVTPTSNLQVFRKPFDGEYSLGSLFDHSYPLEFIHTDGVVVNAYNEKTTANLGIDGHQGYDFVMDTGTAIYAAYDGTVEFAGIEDPFFCPPLGQTVSGNLVKIKHTIGEETFYSIYAHFSSLSVNTGQQVSKGTLLGLSGNTGCSTAPHLHFDIQKATATNSQTAASIDPYGWNSSDTDPWSIHPAGTSSLQLWSPTEAPQPYRFLKFAANSNTGDSAPVAITNIRYAGWQDSLTLNNEYVELTLDTRFSGSSSYALSGFTLSNLAGEKYTFPLGFKLNSGRPVKVYTGEGVNTETELFWNKSTPAWSNDGDCAQLKNASNVRMYYLFYGNQGCTTTGSMSIQEMQYGALPVLDYHPH